MELIHGLYRSSSGNDDYVMVSSRAGKPDVESIEFEVFIVRTDKYIEDGSVPRVFHHCAVRRTFADGGRKSGMICQRGGEGEKHDERVKLLVVNFNDPPPDQHVSTIIKVFEYRYPRDADNMDRLNPTKDKNRLYISTYSFAEDLDTGVTELTLHILNAVTKIETVRKYLKQDKENRDYADSPRLASSTELTYDLGSLHIRYYNLNICKRVRMYKSEAELIVEKLVSDLLETCESRIIVADTVQAIIANVVDSRRFVDKNWGEEDKEEFQNIIKSLYDQPDWGTSQDEQHMKDYLAWGDEKEEECLLDLDY